MTCDEQTGLLFLCKSTENEKQEIWLLPGIFLRLLQNVLFLQLTGYCCLYKYKFHIFSIDMASCVYTQQKYTGAWNENLFPLLAFCEGNHKGSAIPNFDDIFVISLGKLLNK